MEQFARDKAQSNRSPRAVVRLMRVALVGLAAVGITGCALHKPPQSSAILSQALPKATPLAPKWSSIPTTGIETDDWMKSFHDEELDTIVQEAIANNLDLRQSAALVEVARQNVIVVGAKLKPQIGARFEGAGTATDAKSGQNYPSNGEMVGISWEVDVWGRLRAQREAAREDYKAAAMDYAFARQSLAATTAKSWYLAIETHQLLSLAEQNAKIDVQLLELVKVRRDLGRVSDLDLAEAEYELDEAQNQVLIMQGLYSESRRSLELLVGRYPAAELEVADTFVPLPPPVAPGLPSSLLERRPDIVAAQHEVVASFRLEQSAKLSLLPDFTLSVDMGQLSDVLLSVLTLNPWLAHGAVGMSVPIYSGGALQAQTKIATAQEEQSIAHFGDVTLRSFAEVEVVLTNEQLLADRLIHTVGAVTEHREAVRVAKMRYIAGSMDLLSLLQLQEGLIQSQADLIKLRNAQLANRINLHLALGDSFDSSRATESAIAAPKKRP